MNHNKTCCEKCLNWCHEPTCRIKFHCTIHSCPCHKPTPSPTGTESEWEEWLKKEWFTVFGDYRQLPYVRNIFKRFLSSKREAIEKEMDDNGIAGVLVRSIIKKHLS